LLVDSDGSYCWGFLLEHGVEAKYSRVINGKLIKGRHMEDAYWQRKAQTLQLAVTEQKRIIDELQEENDRLKSIKAAIYKWAPSTREGTFEDYRH
jgi:coenzyme F420-reducing hydrogenase delta subunit